ncbi:MAG: hypothetical protein KAQ85_01545 [Thermodesulfovibrionia bacterium]|nr:hypothetical protein [Thermodesulfovibrionia bacterium]
MAFPQVAAQQGSADISGTTKTFSYPPGTINAGETLLCVVGSDGDNSITNWDVTDDWNEIYSASNGSANFMAIAWRKADGTEGGRTFDITLSQNEPAACIVYRITGAEDPTSIPPEVTGQTGGSDDSPDPPSHNTGAGVQDYLWLAIAECDRRTFSGYPYADNQDTQNDGGGSNGNSVAICTDELTGAIQDPGVFTIASNDTWVAATVAVYPVQASSSSSSSQSVTKTSSSVSETKTSSSSSSQSVTKTSSSVSQSVTKTSSSVSETKTSSSSSSESVTKTSSSESVTKTSSSVSETKTSSSSSSESVTKTSSSESVTKTSSSQSVTKTSSSESVTKTSSSQSVTKTSSSQSVTKTSSSVSETKTSSSSSSLEVSVSSSSIAKGEIVWGHHTAVDEDFHRSMTPDYDTGTGEVLGTGDTQRIELELNESKEMDEPWFIGAGEVSILRDKYLTGTEAVSFQWKTGATQGDCIADTWNNYIGAFTSLDWILIKVLRQ